MTMGTHAQPVLGPPQKPGQRRKVQLRTESADKRPGARYRYFNPKDGTYGIFMAGASLRIFYTERKGYLMAPPRTPEHPWWWYYNKKNFHSTGPNADLDRARSINGPFPSGPIQPELRYSKKEATWEEFYAKLGWEPYELYKDDQAPEFALSDYEMDQIVGRLAGRGFKLVPTDGAEADEPEADDELEVEEEESDAGSPTDNEAGADSGPRDSDVSESEGSPRGAFTGA